MRWFRKTTYLCSLAACTAACLLWTSLGEAQEPSADNRIDSGSAPIAQIPEVPSDAVDNADAQMPTITAGSDSVPDAGYMEASSYVCDDAAVAAGRANVPALAEATLRSLGFEVLDSEKSVSVKPTPNAALLIQSAGYDDVVVQMVSMYQALAHRRDGSFGNDIDEILETFFDTGNQSISAHDKTVVWASILPVLISQASLSGAFTTVKKLHSVYRSLGLHWPNARFDVLCTASNEISDVRLQFSPEVLLNGGTVDVSGDAHCLDRQSDDSDIAAVPNETRPVCTAIQVDYPLPVIPLDAVLAQTLWGLGEKDNDDITAGMGQILDNLKVMSQTEDLSVKWSERWMDPVLDVQMSRLMTIELVALEQHRFMELSRLERQIGQIFKGASFYRRLELYLHAGQDSDAAFAQVYGRLMEEHRSEYEWIVKNFAPKKRKKLDKAFQSWTHKISKTAIIYRRLLAGLTAWSEGRYDKAVYYFGDVTEKRSIIVHPQLYSLGVLMRAARGEGLSQETLSYYTRVMLLKVPALMYQTMTEAARFLSKSNRKDVVTAVRQYAPALVPYEVARFYLAYEHEFRSELNAQQIAGIDAWLDAIVSGTESMDERKKRLMLWYGDLLQIEDWAGIAALSRRISSDTTMDQQWRDIFAIAGGHAMALVSQNPDVVQPESGIEMPQNMASCLSSKTEKLSGLERSRAWLGLLLQCLNH